jgi:predicted nucleotidyltransferase
MKTILTVIAFIYTNFVIGQIKIETLNFCKDTITITKIQSFDKISNYYNAAQKSVFGDKVVYVANVSKYNSFKKQNATVEYIKKYSQYCLDVEALFGIPADILLAHTIIQTNSEKSFLFRNAKNHFNLQYWNTSSDFYKINEGTFMKYDNHLHSFLDFGLFFDAVRKEEKFQNVSDIDVLIEIFYKNKSRKTKRKFMKIIKKYDLKKLKDFPNIDKIV